MDESLKAFQLIHRGLITVAAALLVFLVSPDRTAGPFQAALVEFKTLETGEKVSGTFFGRPRLRVVFSNSSRW